MYCVFDNDEHVIAFHNEYDVVKSYIDNVMKQHENADLHIGKIKKKKIKHLDDIDDLYLVRYSDTYVQSGYLIYLEMVSNQSLYDMQYAKDILLKILEYQRISNTERKTLEKATQIIGNILQEYKEYTPTIGELKYYKLEYDPYIYNRQAYSSL